MGETHRGEATSPETSTCRGLFFPTRAKMANKNDSLYPSLMSVIQSSSPKSLLVHPYIWSAQHLAILHCTFVDVDVTRRIFAPVPSPTGEYGLPQGRLFMDGPRWVITAGYNFDEFLCEILDFTGLSFCTKEK